MNAIVAVDQNWAIGKDGRLLFHLSADLRRFRQLTNGGTILMGRKTLESLPGGRPLPNRRNIVLTSGHSVWSGVETVHSSDELLSAIAREPADSVFVIGGGSVYAALLPFCRRACVTRIQAAVEHADTFFPNLDQLPSWRVKNVGPFFTENDITFRFCEYVNLNL
jgi:dihydrofolate reductase